MVMFQVSRVDFSPFQRLQVSYTWCVEFSGSFWVLRLQGSSAWVFLLSFHIPRLWNLLATCEGSTISRLQGLRGCWVGANPVTWFSRFNLSGMKLQDIVLDLRRLKVSHFKFAIFSIFQGFTYAFPSFAVPGCPGCSNVPAVPRVCYLSLHWVFNIPGFWAKSWAAIFDIWFAAALQCRWISPVEASKSPGSVTVAGVWTF